MTQAITNQIVELFNTKGGSMYGGEAVTQLEHALQAATLAKINGAKDELITAALLHDIGHLLHDLPDDSTDKGIDDVHEELAAIFLEKYFKVAVVEPVKLHVAAKRYLCAVDENYFNTLSQPSKVSLEVQGGVMTDIEVKNFEQNKFHQDAVILRKWDDLAKDPNFKTDPVESFVCIMENSLKK